VLGNVKRKVEPSPSLLSTQMRPPWSSMNFRERASPSPVPSTFFSAVPTTGRLGSTLGLPRLCSPTHRPLLASHRRFDRTEIDDRLGEGALVGKSDGRILDDACEQARFEALG
jgi:hypothetical protein